MEDKNDTYSVTLDPCDHTIVTLTGMSFFECRFSVTVALLLALADLEGGGRMIISYCGLSMKVGYVEFPPPVFDVNVPCTYTG